MNPYLSFETLSKYYTYDDSLPLEAELKQRTKTDAATSYELTFRGVDGLPVFGDLFVPAGEGPWPLMIAPPYMAGTDLAARGVLTAWISYRFPGRMTRAYDPDDTLKAIYAETPALVVWARSHTILDFRRLLDLILARYPVDRQRVCYQGASKGAMMGAILGAVDQRIGQFVLRAGGVDFVRFLRGSEDKRMKAVLDQPWYSDEFITALMAPYDGQHFVGRLAPRPVLFQFGRKDTVVGAAAFERMVELAGEPKRVDWYDAGHGLVDAKTQPMIDGRAWVAEQWQRGDLVNDDQSNWPAEWSY